MEIYDCPRPGGKGRRMTTVNVEDVAFYLFLTWLNLLTEQMFAFVTILKKGDLFSLIVLLLATPCKFRIRRKKQKRNVRRRNYHYRYCHVLRGGGGVEKLST